MAIPSAKHWVTGGIVAAVEDNKCADAKMMFEQAAAAFKELRLNGAPDALRAESRRNA